ncbi:hypothetical protein RRG08_015723 [Elysia crispata]|uniref:Uncharacterized protein n=1 Tax=Elysia crispata TaxID=231223 RepID=A0AAE0Z557_9GAST|nr:hypothetical protein RRG08_015723 [Elysia crispata]
MAFRVFHRAKHVLSVVAVDTMLAVHSELGRAPSRARSCGISLSRTSQISGPCQTEALLPGHRIEVRRSSVFWAIWSVYVLVLA